MTRNQMYDFARRIRTISETHRVLVKGGTVYGACELDEPSTIRNRELRLAQVAIEQVYPQFAHLLKIDRPAATIYRLAAVNSADGRPLGSWNRLKQAWVWNVKGCQTCQVSIPDLEAAHASAKSDL